MILARPFSRTFTASFEAVCLLAAFFFSYVGPGAAQETPPWVAEIPQGVLGNHDVDLATLTAGQNRPSYMDIDALSEWSESLFLRRFQEIEAEEKPFPASEFYPSGACWLDDTHFFIRWNLSLVAATESDKQYKSLKGAFIKALAQIQSDVALREAENLESFSESLREKPVPRMLANIGAPDQVWRLAIARGGAHWSLIEAEYWPFLQALIEWNLCKSDLRNTAILASIVRELGWPSRIEFGESAERFAFFVVQHADLRPDFQIEMFPIIEALADAGQFSAKRYAMLHDRVSVNSGQPQRYGTQVHCKDDRYQPRLLEDEEHIDNLRESVGFMPIKEYLELFGDCGE